MGTVGLKDVRSAGSAAPLMFFQLYVLKDRDFTRNLIQGWPPSEGCAGCLP